MDDRHDDTFGRPIPPTGKAARPLSAISHLFLSDIREDAPVDDADPTVVAVLGTGVDGLTSRQASAVAASLLSDDVRRIAVAVIDGNTLALSLVDDECESADASLEGGDVHDVLSELACDVDAWVIALPDPRLPQSRRVLKLAGHWTLVAGSDHESVVGGYRTLKGLCDRPGLCEHRPRVTLAVPDATHPAEAERAARKLLGVCRQFLEIDVELEPAGVAVAGSWQTRDVWQHRWSTAADAAPAFDALVATLTGEPDAPAAPQDLRPTPMRIAPPAVDDTATRSAPASGVMPIHNIPSLAQPMPTANPPATEAPAPTPAPAPMPMPMPTATPPTAVASSSEEEDVIDFPAGANVADVAVARDRSLAATPITPPMLPGGRLAVTTDGGLILVVAAQPGLADLAKIGEAMAWVTQNRQILSMALGQFRLSEHVAVKVRLLVAHADAGADALRPLLGTGDVTTLAYRRLRWGGREGLLLDAA